MAYILQYDEAAVVPYLRALNLSREGRIILFSSIDQGLRVHADAFINDSQLRLSPGSDWFRFDLLFRDPTFRVAHHLRLIVSDASAAYGILRISYIEDDAGPQEMD